MTESAADGPRGPQMSRDELSAWNNGPLIVITAIYSFIYSKPDTHSATISDIVASNRLMLLGTQGGFYRVQTPDGRQGYVLRTDADELKHWRKSLRNSAQDIHTYRNTLYVGRDEHERRRLQRLCPHDAPTS